MIRTATRVAAVLLASFALTSYATIIESEPNNTLATADPLGRVGSGNFATVGTVSLAGVGDVDVFSIDLFGGEYVMANTAGIAGSPIGLDPDTIIALVDSAGTIIEFDDDDSQSFGSNYTYLVPASGTYYVAVSGFGDSSGTPVGQTFGSTSFIGNHLETGPYILTVSVVPEPAALALASLGCLALGFLRRRSH
jgi:hypothetical protein